MAQTANDRDELLTTAEVAELLKVSQVTVSRWIRQGRLRAQKIGPRVVRVRRAHLDRFVASQQVRLMTPEEQERALQAFQRIQATREAIKASHGGVPLPESWPLIRAAREQRGRQISGEVAADYDELAVQLRPITDGEAERRLAALRDAQEQRQRLSAQVGGRLEPPSWVLINESRDERSDAL